ncbi:MAG: transporter substrate-binding domain-containing protein, partial [Flavobacteriaceae bacterium]|nr:transporter substrate-binding domain-containing protein [Flavobacteriaceae bacterium]
MKIKNIFIILFFWTFHVNVIFSQNFTLDTLVYGGDQDYPPYEFLDKNGVAQGFNIDLMKELAKELNLNIKIKLGHWPVIKKEFEEKGTIHITDMFYSVGRDRYLDFTIPIEVQYDEIFVRNDNKQIESLENLHGLKVIVQRSSYTEEYFRVKYPLTELLLVQSEPEALSLLSKGIADAAVVSSSTAQNTLEKQQLNNIRSLGIPILPREYCFVATHQNSALVRTLNKGILELKANKRFKKIEDQWFGNPYKNFVNRHLFTFIIFIGIIAVLFFLIIFFLRRLVKERTQELKFSLDRLTLISKVKEVRLDAFNEKELALKQLEYIQKVFNADACALRFFKNNTFELFVATGIENNELEKNIFLNTNLGALIHQEKKSFQISHNLNDYLPHSVLKESIPKYQFKIYIITPLIIENSTIGLIEIFSNNIQQGFSELDLEHLMLVADQLAVLIQNKKLFDQNENQKIHLVKQIDSRKKAESALKKTGKLLQNIIDNTRSLIYVFNLEHELVLSNKPFQLLFQKSKGSMVGLKRTDFMPEEIAQMHEENDFRVLKKQESIIVEEENMEEDGVHHYLTNKFPLLDEYGKIYAICGISTDITELKKIEEDLLNAKEKAEESNRLKSAFLANMSHEIRTPMNGIIGFSQLLMDREINTDKQQKFITIIRKSSERLLTLINDIIDISKIESGQMNLVFSQTDLKELMSTLYHFFKPEVDTKGMSIKLATLDSLDIKYLNTDKEKLYAILANLIKNAIKYSKEGSIEF